MGPTSAASVTFRAPLWYRVVLGGLALAPSVAFAIHRLPLAHGMIGTIIFMPLFIQAVLARVCYSRERIVVYGRLVRRWEYSANEVGSMRLGPAWDPLALCRFLRHDGTTLFTMPRNLWRSSDLMLLARRLQIPTE
jgi:hypothetical protein